MKNLLKFKVIFLLILPILGIIFYFYFCPTNTVKSIDWNQFELDKGEHLELIKEPHPQRLHQAYEVHWMLNNNMLSINDFNNKIKWSKVIAKNSSTRNPYHILGYPTKFSHNTNDKIYIKYAGGLLLQGNKLTKYKLFDGVSKKFIKQVDLIDKNLGIQRQACHSFYRGGCRFTQELVLEPLPLGEYYLELYDDISEKSMPIYFAVHPSKEDNKFDVAVVYPIFTWQAYNFEGGGNLYYINNGLENVIPSHNLMTVNIQRPVTVYTGLYHHPYATHEFLKVLREHNTDYLTLTELDLHQNPELLKKVKVLVFTGHSEYWTAEMRKNVDDYLKKGGNIANFSGNIAWWKVNYKDGDIYVNKSGKEDKTIPKEFKGTGYWADPKFNCPSQRTFGLSFADAGYPLNVKSINKSLNNPKHHIKASHLQNAEDEIVVLKEHDIFLGTALKKGSHWGSGLKVLDNELDGIPLDENNRLKTGIKHYPKNIKVLARGYGYRGKLHNAGLLVELTPFKGGGKVISFGSIGYYNALAKNSCIAKKIFINSVNYLLKKTISDIPCRGCPIKHL